MYIKPKIAIAKNLKKSYKHLIILLLYTVLIYRLYDYRGMEDLDIPMSISTVLGFAVSLLLGFRTSESYDRWWEARKIWGAIVNDTRTFARQLLAFVKDGRNNEEVKDLIKNTIAWVIALKNSLRDKEIGESIKPFFTIKDYDEVMAHNNVPNGILHLMEQKISKLNADGAISNYEFVALDKSIQNFCDSMGMCERINNTVFPIHYRYFTYVGIIIYVIMLPFGMLKSTDVFMIPIVILIFFFFTTLERIAHTLQDPFKNRGSDTPMSSLANTIEINLRQMLGESNLPDKVGVNEAGALM